MDEPVTTGSSPLDLGIVVALVTLGFAGVVGLIAVLDADSEAGAMAIGFGVTAAVFFTGGTVACALACLARGRLELASLCALVVAGVAIDLLVLAMLFEIDSEAYGKVAGIAFVWTFFALVVLGLTLAVRTLNPISRALYLGAVVAALLGGVLATVLIATAGGDGPVVTAAAVPLDALGDESLLRPLGAALVVLAVLWLAALAAGRLAPRPVEPS